MRQLSFLDKVICEADRALRAISAGSKPSLRPSPAEAIEQAPLSTEETRHAAGLMRVNHSGEVCAQALYQGQALTARLESVRADMQHAADEELDHLAWCEDRLTDLHSRPSIFNPLWYGLSFGVGATAGLISDKVSLGFVAATEERVCAHLNAHLASLPESDLRSRAVVAQMHDDEQRHQHMALNAGGYDFPEPIKKAMTLVSKAMTFHSYRI